MGLVSPKPCPTLGGGLEQQARLSWFHLVCHKRFRRCLSTYLEPLIVITKDCADHGFWPFSAHRVLPRARRARHDNYRFRLHTCSAGAVGCLSIGLGAADVTLALVTGETWFKVPECVNIRLVGEPNLGIGDKDIILYILQQLRRNTVAADRVVEYTEPDLRYLSSHARFAIANMTTEFGGITGIFVLTFSLRARILSTSRVRRTSSLMRTPYTSRHTRLISAKWSLSSPSIRIQMMWFRSLILWVHSLTVALLVRAPLLKKIYYSAVWSWSRG